MKPPSMRSTKSNLKIKFGGLEVLVNVHSATDNSSSSVNVCCGESGAEHEPMRLKQVRYCTACSSDGELRAGPTRKAVPTREGLQVVEEEQELVVSKKWTDEFEVIETHSEAYNQVFLETADVKWLVPSTPMEEDLYAAIAAYIDETPGIILIGRWAVRSKLSEYRLVARGGLLGLIKLTDGSNLRAAPIEPPSAPSLGAKLKLMTTSLPFISSPLALTDRPDILVEPTAPEAYRFDSLLETL